MERLYNVGAYVRLSMEGSSYDSESVENQIAMLSKFIAMMPSWIEQKIYVDDGYSGVSFQRPAFQEMIEDVKKGVINLVLVKDLSRFGRNYLEAGHYLEEFLPSHGCRFVALQDGIDTEDGENDIMPFLNAMNDYYVKNHSDRIRSVMAAKAKDGQKISGHAPYGYRRCDEDNTQLVIDEYSAGIVQRIFQMRSEGMGFYVIAKTLNGENILPPLLYHLKTTSSLDTYSKNRRTWQPSYISKMTKNELYIGNAVQLKRTVVSHRDKREVKRPEDENIRIEGVFPAVVSKSVWDCVQAINEQSSKHSKHKRPPQKQLFSDLLHCNNCGEKLITHRYKSEVSKVRHARNSEKIKKDNTSYFCGRYNATGGAECVRNAISETALKKLIFDEIMGHVKRVKLSEKSVIKTLTQTLVGNKKISKAKQKKEITALKGQLHKLEANISKLYEKRIAGEIPEENFTTQLHATETERLNAQNLLTTLQATESQAEEKLNDIQKWTALIKENAAINELSRDLLLGLIDKIVVGESSMVDGVKVRDLVIEYQFIGAISNGR
ncbi:MAG: recombinase family protein [Defluviitaleaceae bacterium]|nr:recombinase family protein [Defluviitaleaceae bacterium]